MRCQNALLLKFVLSLGNKKTIGKITLTIEATNSILVLLVKRCHHANGINFSNTKTPIAFCKISLGVKSDLILLPYYSKIVFVKRLGSLEKKALVSWKLHPHHFPLQKIQCKQFYLLFLEMT